MSPRNNFHKILIIFDFNSWRSFGDISAAQAFGLKAFLTYNSTIKIDYAILNLFLFTSRWRYKQKHWKLVLVNFIYFPSADPKTFNGWIHSVTNPNDNLLKLRPISGSGSGKRQICHNNRTFLTISLGNLQPFLPFDFGRMSQPPNDEMIPNDRMHAKSMSEHNNQISRNMGEEPSRFVKSNHFLELSHFNWDNFNYFPHSDQHFMINSKVKNLPINNVVINDAISQEQYLKVWNCIQIFSKKYLLHLYPLPFTTF